MKNGYLILWHDLDVDTEFTRVGCFCKHTARSFHLHTGHGHFGEGWICMAHKPEIFAIWLFHKKFVHPNLGHWFEYPLNNLKIEIQVIIWWVLYNFYVVRHLWWFQFLEKYGLHQEILSWWNTYWTEMIYWEESHNWGKLIFLDEFHCWPHCCLLGWFPTKVYPQHLAPLCPSTWCG